MRVRPVPQRLLNKPRYYTGETTRRVTLSRACVHQIEAVAMCKFRQALVLRDVESPDLW